MKFSATVTLQYPTAFSPFSVEDFEKGLDWIHDSGLDGAELCISHYRGLDVGRVKAQLDARGLGCSTLSTGQARGLEGLSLIGVSPEVRKATQARFVQHIDAAAVLGSKVTLGLMRGIGSAQTREADLAALAEAMKPIVEHAQKRGVVLLLEPINRYETALLNSAEAAVDFIENRLGGPACVGILWDLFHANIEDVNFERTVDRLGKRLRHIHLADSNRMFPGYGHLDVADILKYVKRTGYGDYASFECFNEPDLQTVLRETGPWVDSIRAL